MNEQYERIYVHIGHKYIQVVDGVTNPFFGEYIYNTCGLYERTI